MNTHFEIEAQLERIPDSDRMTALYSGEIPLEQVRAAFSVKLLEKMENEIAA